MLKFRGDFEAGICSAFCRWCFLEVMKLNLGRDSEAGFGQDFNFKSSRDADVWSRFWSWCMVGILKMKFYQDLCKNHSGPLCLWQCFLKRPLRQEFLHGMKYCKSEHFSCSDSDFTCAISITCRFRIYLFVCPISLNSCFFACTIPIKFWLPLWPSLVNRQLIV